MNEMTFDFEGQALRTIDRDGEVWFIARDVCNALTLEDVSRAVSRLDEDERGRVVAGSRGGNQEHLIISESGLYSLVLTSVKPEAKKFKKWITSEVIPSIRRTGGYSIDEAPEVKLLALEKSKITAALDYMKVAAQVRTEIQELAKTLDPTMLKLIVEDTMAATGINLESQFQLTGLLPTTTKSSYIPQYSPNTYPKYGRDLMDGIESLRGFLRELQTQGISPPRNQSLFNSQYKEWRRARGLFEVSSFQINRQMESLGFKRVDMVGHHASWEGNISASIN